MKKIKFNKTYWSPYGQYRYRVGQKIKVLGEHMNGNYPKEAGRIWDVEFEDGFKTQAYAEEVETDIVKLFEGIDTYIEHMEIYETKVKKILKEQGYHQEI